MYKSRMIPLINQIVSLKKESIKEVRELYENERFEEANTIINKDLVSLDVFIAENSKSAKDGLELAIKVQTLAENKTGIKILKEALSEFPTTQKDGVCSRGCCE